MRLLLSDQISVHNSACFGDKAAQISHFDVPEEAAAHTIKPVVEILAAHRGICALEGLLLRLVVSQ
jgi:hypothetical protein